MTAIRQFNALGIERFRAFLMQLKADPTHGPLPNILEDFQFTEFVPGAATVEPRRFDNKWEFGCYIRDAFGSQIPERILRTSAGMWSWLALFYFDACCPAEGGRRKVLSLEKYIASSGHIATGLDKHLLFFPWKMVALHGEEAKWLLGGPLRQDSKVVREFANSYRRNVSTPFVTLAKNLYFDADRGRERRGATTNRPGSLRRLDRVIGQLDLTFDIFGMDAQNLERLLPRGEFRRWLSG